MQHTTLSSLRLREADEVERIRLYGPAPINPFYFLRSASGFTLGDLSAYSGIDKRALSRCEAGMYTNPLPSLVNYWVSKNKTTEGALLSGYEDFIDAQRARHWHYFGESLVTPCRDHPLRELRRTVPSLLTGQPLPVGLTEFCQALCLPMDTIQFFEKRYRSQQSVPKVLINALNQVGYNRIQLELFQNNYKDWRAKAKEVTFHE